MIAQTQPDAQLMGWNVRVGATFPFRHSYPSARTIAAYQLPESLPEVLSTMTAGEDLEAQQRLEKQLLVIRKQGHEISGSAIVPGITDVSCPILNYLGVAVAALTVPMVGPHTKGQKSGTIITAATQTAAQISLAIGGTPEPASATA